MRITHREFTEMAGVHRVTLNRWRRESDSAPQPDADFTYDKAEVEQWLASLPAKQHRGTKREREIIRIRELYLETKSVYAVAKQLGIHRETVYRYIGDLHTKQPLPPQFRK